MLAQLDSGRQGKIQASIDQLDQQIGLSRSTLLMFPSTFIQVYQNHSKHQTNTSTTTRCAICYVAQEQLPGNAPPVEVPKTKAPAAPGPVRVLLLYDRCDLTYDLFLEGFWMDWCEKGNEPVNGWWTIFGSLMNDEDAEERLFGHQNPQGHASFRLRAFSAMFEAPAPVVDSDGDGYNYKAKEPLLEVSKRRGWGVYLFWKTNAFLKHSSTGFPFEAKISFRICKVCTVRL